MDKSINNIIVFINTLEKGGAELQAIELSKVLQEKYTVFLVVFYGNMIHSELLARLGNTNVHLIRFSGNKIKVIFELLKLIKKQNIDCIYSFLATTNVYGAFIGKLAGVTYRIGGFRSSRYSGNKLLIQKFIHNSMLTLSVANNFSAKEFLSNHGFKNEKIKVIHNVFLPSKIETDSVDKQTSTIISVGRFVPEKDYETALRAMHRLKEKGLDFKYQIIGYGMLEQEIRNQIHAFGLDDCVQVLINPTNIAAYLAKADVFLQTSLFEGTSNAILEAMYAQLPIVATKVGDNHYMVTQENGFLTEVKDYEVIAEKLILLLQDNVLRERMGEKSREIVGKEFSLDAFRKRHFELLDSLINNSSH